jgi:Flp pilus assembly protein TadB
VALKAPPEAGYRADVVVGVVAGLAGMLFVVTVAAELMGRPALLWAMLLAGAVGVLAVLLVRRRRRLRAETDPDPGLES